MKKALLVLTLLFISSTAHAACGGTCYAKVAGGNWSAAATWSGVSSAGVDSVGPPTASDDVILDASSGQVTVDATAVGKSLTCTGYTGTLTHGAFDLTISGNITLVSGMTYTPSGASSVLAMNTAGTLTTGGKLIWILQSQTAGPMTLGDNVSFVAQKTCEFRNFSNSIDLNGKTVSGNSATNRVLVRSQALGTARTITNTTGTFANADFRDITFSTVADYSAITGLSGDCGGNTNGTFTPAATQTYTGGTDNWSTAARWTSRVPLPQDDVVITGQSGSYTITLDMPRGGKSIDFSGALGTLTATNSVNDSIYGSLTLKSGMTWNNGNTLTLEGRSSYTITTNGNDPGTINQSAFGGTYTLNSAFTAAAAFVFANGTLDLNGFNMTTTTLSSNNSNTRVFTLGSGTYTLTSTGSVWIAGSTGLTINAGTSTILLSDTSASSKTFTGQGKTYNDFKISGGGAGAIILTGANTFNRIYTDGAGTKSITLPGSTTTTIVSDLGLNNLTNLITFTSSAGSATIAKATGNLKYDYVSLTNIPASTSGNAKFYAGPTTHSTDGGGNTNWIFSSAPAGTNDASGSTIDDDENDVYLV